MTPQNLLKKIWIIVSTIGSVVSLASLFDTLIQWVDFFREIIYSYRIIVDFFLGSHCLYFSF